MSTLRVIVDDVIAPGARGHRPLRRGTDARADPHRAARIDGLRHRLRIARAGLRRSRAAAPRAPRPLQEPARPSRAAGRLAARLHPPARQRHGARDQPARPAAPARPRHESRRADRRHDPRRDRLDAARPAAEPLRELVPRHGQAGRALRRRDRRADPRGRRRTGRSPDVRRARPRDRRSSRQRPAPAARMPPHRRREHGMPRRVPALDRRLGAAQGPRAADPRRSPTRAPATSRSSSSGAGSAVEPELREIAKDAGVEARAHPLVRPAVARGPVGDHRGRHDRRAAEPRGGLRPRHDRGVRVRPSRRPLRLPRARRGGRRGGLRRPARGRRRIRRRVSARRSPGCSRTNRSAPHSASPRPTGRTRSAGATRPRRSGSCTPTSSSRRDSGDASLPGWAAVSRARSLVDPQLDVARSRGSRRRTRAARS